MLLNLLLKLIVWTFNKHSRYKNRDYQRCCNNTSRKTFMLPLLRDAMKANKIWEMLEKYSLWDKFLISKKSESFLVHEIQNTENIPTGVTKIGN